MRCSPGGDSEKWLDEVIAQGLQSESAYEQARAVSLRGLLDAEEDAEWLTEPTRDDDSWYRSVLRIAQRRVKSERDARYWFKKFCEGTRFTANGTARMEQRMPAHERGLGLCKPHHLKPLGIKLGLGPIGWHTFRHTYRSWLDETGAPMKVQQELMRHASIQTTMNVYGQAMPASKREANGKVVEMVLRPMKASA